MTRVCVVVTARPSWAKLQTVCEALRARTDVELQIVVAASALLERYGRVIDVIKGQGFEVAAEAWSVYEGENLLTSAKETGALLATLADIFRNLRADVVVGCADRHEVLAVAQAASYQHIPFCHLQGGERTGSIDDKVRDSITALADIHCVCTDLSKHRVYGLTGNWERVHNTGCPSIDLAKRAMLDVPVTDRELGGSGPSFDLSKPFLVILQHPVTDQAHEAQLQMWRTLDACGRIALPRVVLWPGQDAGCAGISKSIRVWKAEHPEQVWRTVGSLPPARFLKLLTQSACLIGNSSAGIRECGYLGVPVVNVGTRQWGRERSENVYDGPHDVDWIYQAVKAQVENGPFKSSTLYGSGSSGEAIAEVLSVSAGIDTRKGWVKGYTP